MKESKGKVTSPSQITNTTSLTSHITIACVDPVPPLSIDALVDKTHLILKSCLKLLQVWQTKEIENQIWPNLLQPRYNVQHIQNYGKFSNITR